MKISKDLVAASSIPFVLSILNEGDDYGYSIIKKIKKLSNNQLEWKEGSLYPVLSKLENKGYLKSYFKITDGRKRKYYSINQTGKGHLEKLKEEWNFLSQTMKSLWKTQTISYKL